MKRIVLSILCVFVVFGASAQTFSKGDKVVNLGLGLGNTVYSGSGYKTSIPPISGSFEYGVVDNLFDDKSSLGVGGYLGYTSSKYDLGNNYDYKYSSTIVGVRGSLHYDFIEKLDTYTGLSLGYNIVSAKSDYKGLGSYKAESSALYWGWYLGARYYFTDSFAAMAEIGYDIAYLNIGVAFKF